MQCASSLVFIALKCDTSHRLLAAATARDLFGDLVILRDEDIAENELHYLGVLGVKLDKLNRDAGATFGHLVVESDRLRIWEPDNDSVDRNEGYFASERVCLYELLTRSRVVNHDVAKLGARHLRQS